MVTAHRSTKEKTRGDRLRACDLASVSRNETRINMRASRERRDKANADRRTVTHVHTHTRTETRTQSAYNNCFASRFLNSLASHPWWQRRQTTRSGRRRCDAARPTRGQCPTTDCPRIVIQFQTNRRITDGSATDHTRPLPASSDGRKTRPYRCRSAPLWTRSSRRRLNPKTPLVDPTYLSCSVGRWEGTSREYP